MSQAFAKATPKVKPQLGFLAPDFYGSGISVKSIDFAKKGAVVPFKSTYFEVQPGYVTPVDEHEVQECWLVLQGKGVLTLDGEEHHLNCHDIVHFSSFQKHSVHNDGSEPLLLCSIYW